jgi:hypothetical protein
MTDGDLPPESNAAGKCKRQTFVVVHGVGRQAELDTLRTLVEGYHLVTHTPRAGGVSRSEADLMREEDGADWFEEVRYSHLIAHHEEYGERDLRRWLRTFRGRLEEIHNERGGGDRLDFSGIESVTDDILLTTKIAKLITVRLKVGAESFESIELSANDFLRQLQLFADRESYRDAIVDQVRRGLAVVAAADPTRRLVVAAHSLGTVVTLIALLQAEAAGEVWVGQVDRFVTFGSPLDLVMVLFPEFFPTLSGSSGRGIRWTNYTLSNDPIATDLRLVRCWFLPVRATGLFSQGAPREDELGPGSLYAAHTDYWHEERMLGELFGRLPEAAGDVRPTRSGWMSGLARLGWAAVLVASWVMLIWWEENVKSHDTERVAALNRGVVQVVLWVLTAGLVGCHAACWSRSLRARWMYCIGAFALAAVLYFVLPPLAILGRPPPPVDVEENAALKSDDWLSAAFKEAASLLSNIAKANSDQLTGNIVLILVPLAALVGVARGAGVLNVPRIARPDSAPSSEKWLFRMLAGVIVFLSLGVGTRSNPSNITQEFGTLFLVFGFWMLTVLLFRIDRVYHDYVRGRRHIDLLHDAWNRPSGR